MAVMVAFATVLGLGGVAFGYFVILPPAIHFLTNYDSAHYTILIRARDYYQFASFVLLGVALAFEVPVFVLALVRLRILTAAQLRQHLAARHLRDDRDRRAPARRRPGHDDPLGDPARPPLRALDRPRHVPRAALARSEPTLRRSSCTSTSRGRCGRRRCSRSRGATTTRCRPTTEEGLAELYDFRDFAHFIEVWILTTNALRTAEDFRQVVVDYAAEAAAHGAVYLEGIFSPSERVRRGVGWDEIFSGYCDGAQEARELHGVEVRLTPDIVRGFPLDEAEQVVRYSAAYRERGVVGVGLGGLEAEFPPEPYEPAFTLARELGPRLGPARRRGRGAAVGARRARGARRRPPPARDPRGRGPGPLREIADRRIVLDVCPISNLRTRVVGSLEEHPLPQLVAAGALCSISTDDPAMFGTDLDAATTRPPPSSGSTRATSTRPGSRARSATRRRRRACARSATAYEWQVP